MVANLSVDQCAKKKYTSTISLEKVLFHDVLVEEVCARDTKGGIDGIMTSMTKLRQYIDPTLNVAYDIQNF